MLKFTLVSALMIATSISAQTGGTDAGSADLAHIRSEYADVLALQGTAKAEVLAIARVFRAKPEMAIDKTKAAGEYCFKSSQGTMLPALGKMEPGKWYFLPSGVIDPHHQHVFATPTIAIAVNVK
jgi:hypothetical protein